MTEDRNKGITSITYNHLNLPTQVTVDGDEKGTIEYVYDASGVKLKKIVTDTNQNAVTNTEYASNYVYKNDNLEYFSTPEGYVTPEESSYRYVYQYKDHLDNVRLSYTQNDSGDLEIIEENNYYPLGLKHRGYNEIVSSLGNSTAQLIGFTGKEEQDELGLGWIDITARNYDPSLGRWMNIDPLADHPKQLHASPYAYANNNPIRYIDPDGMLWIDNGDGSYTAEAGDSAATLAEDADISLEDADKIVQQQHGENYTGEDGEEKSNLDEGDVVRVVGEDQGDVIVIPNDSDIPETDLSDRDFGETRITRTVKDPDALITIVQLLKVVVGEVDPTGNLLTTGLAAKGVRKTGQQTLKSIRTTSSSNAVSAESTGTRTINVKGHFRTLKSGKKVWVRPHTRTIKNKN